MLVLTVGSINIIYIVILNNLRLLFLLIIFINSLSTNKGKNKFSTKKNIIIIIIIH